MGNILPIRQSTLACEGALMVSKWLYFHVLLDYSEMAALLNHLGDALFYQIDRVVPSSGGVISYQDFLENYQIYIQCLKDGKIPEDGFTRKTFQAALSATSEAFYQISLQDDKRIIKARLPVIMLQDHQMHFSKIDGKFRSKVLTREGFSWGVQLSYPQLFQNPKTFGLEKITDSPAFPNTRLFSLLRKWIRYETMPTRFILEDGKKIVSPVRLGKKSMEWIDRHAQLNALGMSVLPFQMKDSNGSEINDE